MADEVYIQEIEEQAALYALGALTGEEAARFKLRLDAHCQLCETELGKCEAVVMALPLSADEIAPPPALRARVLALTGSEQRTRKTPIGDGTLIRASDDDWFDSIGKPLVRPVRLEEV